MFNENSTLPPPVSLEYIPYLWQHSDVLIFLVDINDYYTFSIGYLNRIELESLERLQTSYFKKRYIVSRIVLKHILLNVTDERSIYEISTFKDEYGKVHVHNHNELHICISYTENIVALAISKVEVGIDIELEKRLTLRSNLKNLRKISLLTDESLNENDLLKIWTLKEAYSKFSNINMHLLFNKELDLSSVSHWIFRLDNKYIFSVVAHSDSHIVKINRLQKIDCNRD